MLTLAVLYPGDYLICRQFMPELRVTTLKTFLEVCPPELVIEHRVADGIVKIKSQGGVSNVIFRPLEEPEKLRSLNLNAFYIDEASQVSEAGFMLLQGRLRGKHVRKGFLTSNPAGHDWIYNWYIKQDHLKTEAAKQMFSLIKAPSTENTHLPDGYVESMMQSWSEERIQREIMGSFDAFEGQVYHEFRRDVHVIQPFAIPTEWTRIVGADHGYRNPAAFIWAAVDYNGDLFVYREFYKREWLIEEIAKGREKGEGDKPELGVIALSKGEKIDGCYIDPSTRARRGSTGLSDYDVYCEHFPMGWPFALAQNDKTSGIDRVKSHLKVDEVTRKPKLFIFSTCTNLLDEISKYRYAELGHNQQGRVNEKEEPVKVDDHALDALRYLVMSRPDPTKVVKDPFKGLKYGTIEYHLAEEIQNWKSPKKTDPIESI